MGSYFRESINNYPQPSQAQAQIHQFDMPLVKMCFQDKDSVRIEHKLESFWLFNVTTFNIFKIYEDPLITISDSGYNCINS